MSTAFYFIDPYPGGPAGEYECACASPGCVCPYGVRSKSDVCPACEMGTHEEEWDTTNRAAGHEHWDES